MVSEEKERSLSVVSKPTPAEGLEDFCWALLNTEEFLTQH